MPENPVNLGAQFRSDSPDAAEQESVRTTIVGGRPPGSGKPLGPLPRGVEVLLKKAAVDPSFRKTLLENPMEAASSIQLELDPVEQSILHSIPEKQLVIVIEQIVVPEPQRRAFLGHAAALMLAALSGVPLPGCGERATKGIRPGDIRYSAGIQPGTTETEPIEVIEPFPAPAGVRPDFPEQNETSPPGIE